MQYPFPFIPKNTKPAEPKLYLCKPDRTTIGRIKYADKITLSLKSGTDLSELSFVIHEKIKIGDKWKRYYMYDLMKIKYLIRADNVWGTDWYVINAPHLDDTNKQWQVHAYLLPYQLQDKKFYSYETTDSDGNDSPVTLVTALTSALSTSYTWKIGHIDDSLKSLYRSFSVDDTTALDFIQQIMDKFNAVVSWDTNNQLVNVYDKKTYLGSNKRLYITWKKYLTALEEDINADTLVTRLHCLGSDDISLNSVNPTGQDYIEDYTYFIGNYKKDSNGNIIGHSDWMSDGLCQALIDYKQKIADNTDKFKNYLTQINTYQSNLLTLQNDLIELQTDLDIADDLKKVNTNAGCYFSQTKTYTGKGWTFQASLSDFQPFIVMAKSTNPITVQLNGSSYRLNSSWTLLKKITNQDYANFVIGSGQRASEINLIITLITNDEYSTSGNENVLLNKYNSPLIQDKINAKNTEIANCNNQITSVQNNITNLQSSLNPQNNFSQDQLDEWENFIKEDTFSISEYTNANDAMSDATIQLAKLQQPTSTYSISLTNFLQVVECQTDWEKLILNDIVTIIYDNDTKIRTNMSEIDIDFDAGTINLQITNTKEAPKSEKEQFANLYASTIKHAQTLKKNKLVWNSAKYNKKKLDNYLTSNIDASSQNVIGGIDHTEGIDDYGVYSVQGNYGFRIYKATLLTTSDGGNTWNVLASPKGLNAESITGELMLDSQTSITNSTGSIQLTHESSTLDGSNLFITNGGLQSSEVNADLVNNATLGAQAKDQVDNLAVGTVNYLSKSNCFGSIADLSNQSIGHSKWGLLVQYSQINGFTVPSMQIKGKYTVSFIAYANKDDLTLNMSLSTRNQEDKTIDHSIVVGKSAQLYQWITDYQYDDLLSKDNFLKFWLNEGNIDDLIVVTDCQLEYGTVRSSYHEG